jgi:hypothetical protein
MAHTQHTPDLASLEKRPSRSCSASWTRCLFALLNPTWRSHESLKKLSDSEVITIALFQQLRGVESERSFLRDTQRFFVHLFPGVAEGCIPPLCTVG